MEETNYKAYLSKVAKQMILIHDANLLSRLIIRTLTRQLRLKHAGVFIYNKIKQEYIINFSRGAKGLKIPVGFTKITKNNPIIKFFLDKNIPGNKDFISAQQIATLKEQNKDIKKTFDFYTALEDELFMYRANIIFPGFFRKDLIVLFLLGDKIDNSEFSKDDIEFLTVLSSDVVMAIQNAKLFEDIKKQLDVNKQLFLNTVETLAKAIDIKSAYTHGHIERVMEYSMILLKYIPPHLIKDYDNFANSLKISALLHDIGKIGVPENILNKTDVLTQEERKVIEKHPVLGAEILEPISEFKNISLGVKYHHEKYDGTGYPEKLKGEEIPLIAKIISVADSYDAMISDRPYRKGLAKDIVIKEIENNKNKQFCPIVVQAFLDAVTHKEL
ncbi:MAG: HD domain-containing protein [Elusimicrobia bacterium]|nr:HD domain-containing protein [Elusimicrobiota bacterium]